MTSSSAERRPAPGRSAVSSLATRSQPAHGRVTEHYAGARIDQEPGDRLADRHPPAPVTRAAPPAASDAIRPFTAPAVLAHRFGRAARRAPRRTRPHG